MSQLVCDLCDGIQVETIGNVPFESKLVGTISVPSVQHTKCNKCGHSLISYEGAETIFSFLKEKEEKAIKSLPIGEFISPKQACHILNITKQAFSKHPKIKRGFILSTVIDGKKLYNKKSVELYRDTNDGRFLIKSMSVSKYWIDTILSAKDIIEEDFELIPSRSRKSQSWTGFSAPIIQSNAADNYSTRLGRTTNETASFA